MVRLLQPLKPMSAARVQWENALNDALCRLWECDSGDVAAFLDAHMAVVDEQFSAGATPRQAASLLNCID